MAVLHLDGVDGEAIDTLDTSSKRGLIDIAEVKVEDTELLLRDSDISWYYNYGPTPSLLTTNPNLTFIPMLFNTASTTPSFLTTITTFLNSGTAIPYVLSYNEPDGTTATGGSNISPSAAAKTWIEQLEPLRKLGVRVGAPAVTGSSDGFTWLASFFEACDGGCTADFMPVHWYGDFEGLVSHMGEKRSAYPNLTLWITEYALPNTKLNATQSFFNESASYFDRLDYVTHYSYFGSFRSSKSNVGLNVAMLDSKGRLTSIGSWYNGGKATSNNPSSGGIMFTVGRSLASVILVGLGVVLLQGAF